MLVLKFGDPVIMINLDHVVKIVMGPGSVNMHYAVPNSSGGVVTETFTGAHANAIISGLLRMETNRLFNTGSLIGS